MIVLFRPEYYGPTQPRFQFLPVVTCEIAMKSDTCQAANQVIYDSFYNEFLIHGGI